MINFVGFLNTFDGIMFWYMILALIVGHMAIIWSLMWLVFHLSYCYHSWKSKPKINVRELKDEIIILNRKVTEIDSKLRLNNELLKGKKK